MPPTWTAGAAQDTMKHCLRAVVMVWGKSTHCSTSTKRWWGGGLTVPYQTKVACVTHREAGKQAVVGTREDWVDDKVLGEIEIMSSLECARGSGPASGIDMTRTSAADGESGVKGACNMDMDTISRGCQEDGHPKQ